MEDTTTQWLRRFEEQQEDIGSLDETDYLTTVLMELRIVSPDIVFE